MLTLYLLMLALAFVVGVVAVMDQCPSVEDAYLVMGCGDFRASTSIAGDLGGAAVTAVLAVVVGWVSATMTRRRVSVLSVVVWASVGLLYLALQATLAGQGGAFQVMGAALAVIGAVSGLWAGIGLCQTRAP